MQSTSARQSVSTDTAAAGVAAAVGAGAVTVCAAGCGAACCTDADARRALAAAALAGAVCGALILFNHLIILMTTEIVVTTFRFVYKTGLISRNTQEVSLGKIEEITLRQSIWGRLLDYGHLVLRGTGVGVIELPALDNPIQLRRIIENARSSLRGRASNAGEDNGDGN